MAKRIRIRRESDTGGKLAAKRFDPLWGQFDIVRLKTAGEGADHVSRFPDFFTVIEVIPDESAHEKEEDDDTYTPGDRHMYVLRSLVSGIEVTLTQSMLSDIDTQYARYITAHYKSVLIRVVSTLDKLLTKEPEGSGSGVDDVLEDDNGYAVDDDEDTIPRHSISRRRVADNEY